MSTAIAYADSSRIGKFNVTFEQQRDRALWQAILGLCTVLEAFAHESGRGTTFIAASELFEGLTEGAEIPEYRIQIAVNEPFKAPELEARRKDARVDGSVIGIVAIRNTIVRVPPAQLALRPAAPGQLLH